MNISIDSGVGLIFPTKVYKWLSGKGFGVSPTTHVAEKPKGYSL